MNQQLTDALGAQWLIHQSEQYCYYHQDEINNIEPLSSPFIATLNHLAAIKVSGQDAEQFLQGQLTIDVSAASQYPLGAYCSRKGRIISLFYFGQHNDDYYLLVPKALVATLIKQLKLYVIASKVTLEVQQQLVLAISAPYFAKLQALITEPLLTIQTNQQLLTILSPKQLTLLPTLLNEQPDLQLIGDWAWHKHQLYQSIPRIYQQSLVKFLPHDLELHKQNAIALDKGCYIGQEIIARMHYKAKLKYTLSLEKNIEAPELTIGENNIIDILESANGERLVLKMKKKSET